VSIPEAVTIPNAKTGAPAGMEVFEKMARRRFQNPTQYVAGISGRLRFVAMTWWKESSNVFIREYELHRPKCRSERLSRSQPNTCGL
jgi:hypothetical protein